MPTSQADSCRQAPGRNIPLRMILMGSWVLQVLVVIGLTGYFSLHDGQAAIHNHSVLYLGALLLSTGLGWLTARWLVIPIRRLNQAARALAEGNLNYRVENQHSIQEINALAQSFNQMAEQLQTSFTALLASETSFKNIAANVPGAIFRYVLHPDGSDAVLYMSPGCYQLWEVEAEVVKQDAQILWEMIHPDDLPAMQTSVAESARTLQLWHQEWRITTPSGQLKWLQGAGNPTLQPNGDVIWDTVILDVSERQIAEQALKIQRDFNQLIAEITSRFVDLNAADLDVEIERTLHLIGTATQVDTSYVFRFNQDAQTMSMTHEWCRSGCPHQRPLAQDIPLSAFPWSMALAQQREIIQVPCVADLPAEAAIDQAGWQRFNIVALLAVPLIQKSMVTGLMGFASFNTPIVWEDEAIRLLGVMGQTIANAQERAQDEHQLFMSEERLRLALKAANQGLYDLNPQTGEAVVSPEYAMMLGYDPDTFHETNARWIERLHPDDRETVARIYRDYIAGKLPEYKVEFRQRTRTGGWKWILSLGKIVDWDAAGQPLRMLGTHTDIDDRKLAEIQLQQTVERERLVRVITERIRQSLDLDEILTTTVTQVRQVLQTDRVILFKLEPDGSGNIIQEAVGANWQRILGQTIVDPCFQAETLQRYLGGQERAITDIDDGNLESCYANFLRQFNIRATLIVPIIQTDVLWGLLIAHQCNQPRQWSEAEIQLLKQLADQVAIALQQSQLYQQLQQLNVSLEQQVQQRTSALQQALEFESLLQRIADKVRETLDEEQVIHAAVEELARILHTNGCGIGIFDLDQETSTICYARLDAGVPSIHDRVFHFSNYPELYQQLLRGEPFQFCGTFDQSYPTPSTQAKGTLLVSPLVDNRGALGELWLYRTGESIFAGTEVRLVQQVANQCAIGIRQSRLYQASQVQVEALEQLHQMKDDFLSTVSHELRSPMTNIKMAIQMVELRLQQQQVNDNRLTTYLQILESACSQELALINDLLDLQRLEAGMQPLELESVDLNHWLPSIAEPFKARALEQHQQLTLALPLNLPTITTDLASFKRIVTELLHNACKYTPPAEKITVTVQIQNTILQIQVCNSGVELPPEELPRLFEKFYRVAGSDRWKHGGTGLGLALVKRLVEHLHGSIAVENVGGWICFTVQLPVSNCLRNEDFII